MRVALMTGLLVGLIGGVDFGPGAVAQPPSDGAKSASKTAPVATGKDSTEAAYTRSKLLKIRVSAEFTDVRLGDVLKELSHLVDVQCDQTVMWAYARNFPYSQKVTFSVKEKPLEVALDQLFTKAGGGLGYVVVSKEGDKYDGWVRLTTTGERGTAMPATSTPEGDETIATERLALAKKLLDAGKPAAAKPVLEIVAKKYPSTKAGMEAKELLEKLGKE